LLCACDTRAIVDAGAPAPSSSVDAFVVTAADASAQTEPDAAEDASVDLDAVSEQGMRMIEEASGIIQANIGDCDKMGAALDAYYAKHRAAIDFTTDTYRTLSKEERKPIQTKYRPRFDLAWKALQPGLKKCKQQPQIKEIFKKGT
jgi:hypothetical protein